ncbi:hypothetical protein QJS04_geneDACA013487 [Acorus gramineus]|uniref:Reverse transcriptase zinc-binding domain-containing protein n=1 Tax=Acorus gramineus TaxID=55184 RepID=A0AAV9AG61_ACOGR|nr:hypothetical protein QJS04_geneDACA013487 [Acorus gramineus]
MGTWNPTSCVLCRRRDVETTMHLFCECLVVKEVWGRLHSATDYNKSTEKLDEL